MGEQERDTEVQETVEKRLGRRGLIAAAAAIAAGIAASRTAQPVAAVDVFSIPGDYTASAIGTVWKITNNGTGQAITAVGNGGAGLGAYGGAANSYGVFGNADNGSGARGIYGRSPTGTGTFGEGTGSNTTGVQGEALTGIVAKGVYGRATSGYGVYGEATANSGYGVIGTATNSYGVIGRSNSGNGVRGESTSNIGVYGTAPQFGIVGNATATGGYGIYGLATVANSAGFAGGAAPGSGAYAAVFGGPVVVNGPFTVVGGPKSAAVAHPDGSHRRLYCVEAPEAWFEDFGEGKIVAGRAEVKLDPDFAAVVDTGSLHVFCFESGGNNSLHLAGKTTQGFTVQADTAAVAARGRRMQDVNGTFSYRVVAKRKDNVGGRLERVEIPKLATPPITAESPTKISPPPAPTPPPPDGPSSPARP